MKTELEQLLNSLIEKGWKPFGEDRIKEINYVKHNGSLRWYLWGGSYQRWKSIRELVSIESGLWQFVCENGMIKSKYENYVKNYEEYGEGRCGFFTSMWDDEYKYRLIESALKDERELESFILDNIKIEGLL